MKAAARKEMIDVDALRVGMFVHLDLAWMSHPFPLGNFRISHPEQISTLRSLGLRQVRWSPAQSGGVAPLVGSRCEATDTGAAPAADALPAQPAAAAPSPAQCQHREQLSRQAESLALCERQFAEAARDCAQLTDRALAQPQEARAQAEALSRALVDKMLVAGDVCIRLLSDAAGDQASTHALNVTVISLLLGRTFHLGRADMLDLGVGAILHDIGMLELPEHARHGAHPAGSVELRQYQDHVARGVALARRMGLSVGATQVLAQHHEHADGSGFPLRLNTDRMTAAARIVALVNRYDELCNPRLPSQALTPHEALALLFAQGRNQYDTSLLGVLIKMLGVYPAGTTVQLTDDRFALVVGANATRSLRPRVLVHDAGVPRDEALVVDLDRLPGLGIRRCVKPQQLPGATLDYLAPGAQVVCFFEPMAPLEPARPAAPGRAARQVEAVY